jgi:catechol 2,3-dioxygenase-like lactoylglutathione lyase family enzyme
MIHKLTHTTIYVLDQERAKTFYTEKLGFEVHTDQTLGSFRWLTVAPPGQSELEIVLMAVDQAPSLDEEARGLLRRLVEGGKLGAAVFETKDCRKTFSELSARGVEFKSEPQERFYGIEALFRDDSGNWFSLTQRHQ